MSDPRTSQLNQRIVALAKDGRSPSPNGSPRARPFVALHPAPEDGRPSTSSESGISYVSCSDWRSSPPPAYTPAKPPHYSLARQAAPPLPLSPVSPISEPSQKKPTSAFTRKLADFFAPNETEDALDNLVGDFIHPKKPKQRDATNTLAAGGALEIAVEVVQEEWSTGGRNGNNTRRASRFTFNGRNRDSEPAVSSS